MTDYNEALTFINKIHDKVKANDQAATLCATVNGMMKLKVNDLEGTKVRSVTRHFIHVL